jgi:hypothetical protein
MLPERTREELASGLDRAVEEILEKAGITEPPVDAFAISQAMGIAVALDNRQEGRARYVRLENRRRCLSRPTILLRPEPRFERRQWAVAHEIGEHAAYRVFGLWGVDPREMPANAREQVANQLAGRLLLPTVWFEADAAERGWDLIALKALYRTASHELIARRMLDCRPPVIITIFDHHRISFRRSNLPGRAPPLYQAEKECRESIGRRLLSMQTQEGPNRVQGWPIHEDGWKREILRMEFADCEVCDCGEAW